MIKGIIFDMDGVISDTQKVHADVESEILKKCGVNITPDELTQRYSGVKTKEFFTELLKTQKKEYDINKLLEEKWRRMSLEENKIEAIPGAVELIRRLKKEDYPMAVASASNLKYVNMVLEKLEIKNNFLFVVAGDMVSKGKPDPESFLLAAKKIKIKAQDCLVIEDGISGMQAAQNAGMHCIGLVKDKNKKYPTKNLVTSLSEITPDYLKKV